MLNQLIHSLKNFKTIFWRKQAQSPSVSKVEEDAICKNGVVGLGAVWDVYDMWI